MTPSQSLVPTPQQIRRLSRILASFCLFLMVLLPLGVAVYWARADESALAVRANLPADAIDGPLLTWQRIAGGLLAEAPLALLLIGVAQARKCFRLFSAGSIFAFEAALCLRRFAGWVLASVVTGIVAATAISVVITLHNAPDLRHLAVAVGSDQALMLFFAGMVWLMAAVLSQGRALAEENASFI